MLHTKCSLESQVCVIWIWFLTAHSFPRLLCRFNSNIYLSFVRSWKRNLTILQLLLMPLLSATKDRKCRYIVEQGGVQGREVGWLGWADIFALVETLRKCLHFHCVDINQKCMKLIKFPPHSAHWSAVLHCSSQSSNRKSFVCVFWTLKHKPGTTPRDNLYFSMPYWLRLAHWYIAKRGT